ncbi:MAG: phage holin family protein [Verrucomicrobiaceae bacterium]|nr:phage holin family protein [Verrucomicrobiaceae bacterium]
MENGLPAPSQPPPRSRAGGFLRALALYIEARGRLLQIEGQEAATRVSSVSGHFVLTLGSLIIGWMLATPALIWIIAEKFGWHWSRVALGGAALHLVIGFLLLFLLKLRFSRLRFFEETFNQLRRDREWLSSTND